MSYRGPSYILTVALLITLAWLLVPIVMPLSIAFSETEAIAFPPRGFTLAWIMRVFELESFVEGFKLSVVVALAASIAALLLNLPVSYLLTRFNVPGRRILERLFELPILVPQIVLSFALLLLLVKAMGITSLAALIAGHLVIVYPYSMRIVYAGLINLNREIDEAAVSLGAGRLRAFFQVVLPNVREALIGAFISSFMISFNAVAISLFLGVGNVFTLPVAMLNYLVMRFDPTLSALSLLLVGFTISLAYLSEKLLGLGLSRQG